MSNGRVGWNIVTSWLPAAARNFGGAGSPAHEERYARGEEFVATARSLKLDDVRSVVKVYTDKAEETVSDTVAKVTKKALK